MSNKITIDEWISEVYKPTENTRPAGSFTVMEVVEKTGKNQRTVAGRLEMLVKTGKLKKGKFMDEGCITNYYLPIENGIEKPDGRGTSETKATIGTKAGSGKQNPSAKNSKKANRK
jgi:hypothetical protein